ncbi:MAG: cation:proton antiporter [Candidatus Diapherotrites archaeon]
MIDVSTAFFIISLVIGIGYLGTIIFKKTKVSEILILLSVGLLIGPFSSYLGPQGAGIIPFEVIGAEQLKLFEGFLPFFSAFALTIILFEGGLHLNFFKVIKFLGESFAFTLLVFLLSTAFVFIVFWFGSAFGVFSFNPLVGLMLGAILGGTSSEIVIPLINKTSANEETKTLLSIESALTDALCVVIAVAIAEIILLQSFNASHIGSKILSAFTIAGFFGLVFGLFWLKILDHLKGKPYEYLLTLGALLFLYSFSVFFGGNGAIAALTFGLVLGNSEDITRMLRLTQRSVDSSIKSFQEEVSFLVRTFFFVYLGVLFKLEFLTLPMLALSLVLFVLLIAARYAGATFIKKFKPVFAKDRKLITTMAARGLASAVLISLPLSMGLQLEKDTIDMITTVVFLVIFLSNIIATLGVFVAEKENGKEKKEAVEEKATVSEDQQSKIRLETIGEQED